MYNSCTMACVLGAQVRSPSRALCQCTGRETVLLQGRRAVKHCQPVYKHAQQLVAGTRCVLIPNTQELSKVWEDETLQNYRNEKSPALKMSTCFTEQLTTFLWQSIRFSHGAFLNSQEDAGGKREQDTKYISLSTALHRFSWDFFVASKHRFGCLRSVGVCAPAPRSL